ncbi:hypothetical protein AVEN_273050-1 [Araneus ventricosus]|uniref:Uncharacterized protein n=1 Tax=Araneus ventricosus TaxID=182803 RepID=A0A4Y2RE66_ARAVE|nr:hypothetical protein AVEN_273050-1 [Araneus ventricosus]
MLDIGYHALIKRYKLINTFIQKLGLNLQVSTPLKYLTVPCAEKSLAPYVRVITSSLFSSPCTCTCLIETGPHIYKPYLDRTEAGNQPISLALRSSDVVSSSRT